MAPAAAAPAGRSTQVVVGSAPATRVVRDGSRTLGVTIRPNRSAGWNTITLAVRRAALPLRAARVTLSFAMPAMAMGTQTFVLPERSPGVYVYTGPALVMPGRWNLTFRVRPRDGRGFTSLVADRVAP